MIVIKIRLLVNKISFCWLVQPVTFPKTTESQQSNGGHPARGENWFCMYLRLPQILIHNAGSHMAVKHLAAFSLSFTYDFARLASLSASRQTWKCHHAKCPLVSTYLGRRASLALKFNSLGLLCIHSSGGFKEKYNILKYCFFLVFSQCLW